MQGGPKSKPFYCCRNLLATNFLKNFGTYTLYEIYNWRYTVSPPNTVCVTL